MGWDGDRVKYWKNGKPDIIAESEARWYWGDGKDKFEVLKAVAKGSVIYSAIKVKETGEVFGVVSLTRKDGDYLMFKDMSEDVGPFYYDCPKSVLNLLTPTQNEEALKWREKCVEYAKDKKTNPVYIKNSKVGDLLIYQHSKILEHKPDNWQFHTDWWQVVGTNTYVKKSNVTPDTAMVYTKENLEKCFIEIMETMSSKELYRGLPSFIENGNKKTLPDFYSNLVNKEDVPLSKTPYMWDLEMSMQDDGTLVFTGEERTLWIKSVLPKKIFRKIAKKQSLCLNRNSGIIQRMFPKKTWKPLKTH